MLSIFGFVNVALLANARVLYALGRDGALFPAAARVHPRFGSPHVALLLLVVDALNDLCDRCWRIDVWDHKK